MRSLSQVWLSSLVSGAVFRLYGCGPAKEFHLDFLLIKHFETLYTGWVLRAQRGNVTPSDIALDEVLQPNVEKYKKEVKKAMNK